MSATPFDPLAKENLAHSIATRMFEMPAMPLANVTSFFGAGVYALYYSGPFAAYAPLTAANASGAEVPIYVGKADAPGGRQGGAMGAGATSKALYGRIVGDHRKSINQATNLDVNDFAVRWLAVDDIWIPLGESALISNYVPVWNKVVDGFGNHDPGKGRINGLRTRWDTLHPGRTFAPKYPARPETPAQIEQEIAQYFSTRGQATP